MKKRIISILLIMIMILSITGCKKDNDNNIEEVNNEQATVTKVQPSEENNEEHVEEVTDEEPPTVEEDVYGNNTTEAVDDNITDTIGEVSPVTDEDLKEQIKQYFEKFYYNIMFMPESETGEITESDMQLFAISFIYQYEYNELRFDAEKFVLYIPEENVTEVINRFFDYEFIDHGNPADSMITYEDGFYLMPGVDKEWDKPELIEVTKTSDFGYKALFEITSEIQAVDDPTMYYEIIIEERESRFVMLNYKKIVVEQETETEE